METQTTEESKIERRRRMRRETKKRWRTENPEKHKALRKRIYDKNREKFLEEKRKHYAANAEHIKKRMRAYAKANRQKINSRSTMRRKRDPEYKIKRSLGGRIRYAIKEQRGKKAAQTIVLCGCTMAHLRKHIESQFKPGMTWDNHSAEGWHIDHILPCASFNLLDPDEQRRCFHWTNLQPLWAADNHTKGARLSQAHQPELPLASR